MHVSALMATYAGDNPVYFSEALESVFTQTRLPDELVLVVDGPISAKTENVISHYQRDPRIATMIVRRLAKNCGLAHALNDGIGACSGDWIMRMDSDDVAMPDRLELQLAYIDQHPSVDVFTSWCEEFITDSIRTRIKSSPITHEAVVQALKWRNILVHPTVLIRSETLRRFQYRSNFGKLEDYDLFVRLAIGGARFRVIPKALLRFRINDALIRRRGGIGYLMNEMRFRTFCWQSGLLTARQFMATTMLYIAFRLAGTALRGWLYSLARVSSSAGQNA